MIKNLLKIIYILTVVTMCPLFVACDNNRPTFPNNQTPTEIELDNSEKYKTILVEQGIKITSSALYTISDGFKVATGSLMKIEIDETSNILEIDSLNGKKSYINLTTKKLINGVMINTLKLDLSELENYITVNYDMNISLVETDISLSAIMLCHKYENETVNTIYNKFNYKSSNYRKSLLSHDENYNLKINDDVFYLIFDENYNVKSTNIASNATINQDNLNINIETFYEAIFTSIVFVYEDAEHNLFLTTVHQNKNYSLSEETKITTNYDTFDTNFNQIKINLAKYYLQ